MTDKMCRTDMLSEMVSEQINIIEDHVNRGNRVALEEWLGPLLHRALLEDLGDHNDEDFARGYAAIIGKMPRGWEEQ